MDRIEAKFSSAREYRERYILDALVALALRNRR
jgi:hypothetical protein